VTQPAKLRSMQELSDSASSDWTDSTAREAWVQMKLVQVFMRHAVPALHSASLIVVVLVAILYGHVDQLGLWLWGISISAITLIRYWVVSRYRQKMNGVSGPLLDAFMARYAWTWTLSAIVWGALMFLFFLQAPVYHQFVCMTVLVALPGFAVGTFSSYLRGFSGYVDGLMITVIAALVFFLVQEQGEPSSFNTWGMLILALIYWTVIRASGQRIHAVQRANLELQFDNDALVISLTEKSRAALEAVAVKNRFIASAAHDLRQPVHALALYASWLAAEPALVAEITPKISRSTRAVNDLFNSLFDFAGLESETLRVRPQVVELAALIQDLRLQYEPVALERGLKMRTRASPAVVWSDPILLKRLLGNLISNALKNTRRGGVLLAARRRANAWRIEVWDTGAGIAEEHQQAIFQEFYRIPHAGTDEGFGLGLAIVSRLSYALGHKQQMTSRLGRGSVFWVELRDDPRTAAPAVAKADPAYAPDGWPVNGF
jgi:signal transduction histidine kinase